jgi:archaemetzincin
MGKIILIILCQVEANLIVELKQRLELAFHKTVEVRYAVQKIDYAYDPKRKQFVSPRLISRLRGIKKHQGEIVLGITDVDLYSPDYDYVYGEAEMASGVATLSLFRLKGSRKNYASPELFEERAVREAIHEIAHLYQLNHCSNPNCVMHPCPSVADVDKAGHKFCIQCGSLLTRNIFEALAVS